MKAPAVFGVAIAAIALSPAVSAEPDVTADGRTASAVKCLLEFGKDGCGEAFVGGARLAARQWLWSNPSQRDFGLGPLISYTYVATETDRNFYVAKFLRGRVADLYDVKFAHAEKTFYIVHPDPDGKIRHMAVRNGGPSNGREDVFVGGPG